MKRTLLVLALGLVLVLALGATPAFAKYAGYSSTVQYVPWATALAVTTGNADVALMASGPHVGYATTTVKCAVCHSVHRGGSALLNEGTTCAYCHTTTAHGGGAVAVNLISWDTLNGGPHGSRCTNTDCHGGPHGVGASIYAGPASKLLTAKGDTKLLADATANGIAAGTLASYSANTRALAIGAVCSQAGCHNNSAFGVIAANAQLGVSAGVAGHTTITGHRVVEAASGAPGLTGWNANGTDFPGAKTGLQIAFAPVDSCDSCHDLTDDNNAGLAAFPHAINDVVSVAQGKVAGVRTMVWLTGGAFAGDTKTVVNVLAPNGASTIVDGTCIKCHRGSATSGVGFGY